MQLGTAAAIEVAGYEGNAYGMNNAGGIGTIAANVATGLPISSTNAAVNVYNGQMILNLLDAADNTWSSGGNYSRQDNSAHASVGTKSLAGPITRVRVTTVGGVDLLDAGKVSVSCQ